MISSDRSKVSVSIRSPFQIVFTGSWFDPFLQPVPVNRQLLRRVEPMLPLLHHLQAAVKALDERVQHSPFALNRVFRHIEFPSAVPIGSQDVL